MVLFQRSRLSLESDVVPLQLYRRTFRRKQVDDSSHMFWHRSMVLLCSNFLHLSLSHSDKQLRTAELGSAFCFSTLVTGEGTSPFSWIHNRCRMLNRADATFVLWLQKFLDLVGLNMRAVPAEVREKKPPQKPVNISQSVLIESQVGSTSTPNQVT